MHHRQSAKEMAKAEKKISPFYLLTQADKTYSVHVLKTNSNYPQVRGSGSTVCPTQYILNSLGN